jgi:dimethylaniline monooxygenase (N-oxide forming)
MDLTSYLHNRITKPEPSAQQRNTARMLYFSENFGNPGTIDEALRPSDDPARTPIAVISDTYLDHAKNGMITPFRQNVSCATSRTLALESGDKIDTDVLIACTGFSANIPCDDALSHVLSYRSDDLMQPLLLNNGTLHHQLPGAAFVGMYRGPFFGVMEMQARWSMGVASGLITAPSLAESIEGIRYENDIRHTAPRPQFPRADYVGYMHALATRIGCVPCDLLEETQENDKVPMIPADFRRAGFGANKTIASLQRNRMIERLTV